MATAFRLDPVTIPSGYLVEWVDEEGYILSHRHRLFFSADLQPPFTPIGTFPVKKSHALAARFAWGRRLLRFMYYNVLKQGPNRLFVTFGKSVGLIVDGRFQAVDGLMRPARFLRGSCAVDADGGVYLGEYLANPDRTPLHIYYLAPDSTQLAVVCTLPAGRARHIHGIFADPYEPGSLWLTTGDLPNECRIQRTRDGFKTLEVIGEGDETWRTVGLAFREDAVYYGMDAEFQQNYVYRLDRADGSRKQLFAIDGPIYYAKTAGGVVYFSLTAEGCPSQTVNRATIWAIDQRDQATAVAHYAKDALPKLLMPGTLHFALGPGRKDTVFFYGVALKGAAGRNFALYPSLGTGC